MTPRQQAIAAGGKRYHGRPCKNCQGTERWVASRCCVACVADRSRERSAAMTGLPYAHKLLKNRRYKALRRIAARTRQQEVQHGTV